MDKVREYFDRTHDPRAGQVLAREKIIMGDEYMQYLSRYDKALELYRAAVELDPNSADAKKRVEMAEQRRFVSMTAFANVKTGMKEDAVRALGRPAARGLDQAGRAEQPCLLRMDLSEGGRRRLGHLL